MATHSSILAWRIPRTGAWQAIVHGISNSQTLTEQLTLSSEQSLLDHFAFNAHNPFSLLFLPSNTSFIITALLFSLTPKRVTINFLLCIY